MSENTNIRNVVLEVDGKKYDIPLVPTNHKQAATITGQPTEVSYDIALFTSALNDAGLKVADPGFANTVPVMTNLTYIDGEKGILLHSGYEIGDLIENKNFTDVSYLLENGELPSKQELQEYEADLISKLNLPDGVVENSIKSLPKDAEPMAVLQSAVAALNVHYSDVNVDDIENAVNATREITSKVPMAAIAILRHSKGEEMPSVDPNLSYMENMTNMMFGDGKEPVDPLKVKAMEVLFILHADHDLNASTTTARTIASSGATPYGAVSGAIGSLSGPSHGGANRAVLEMLEEIGTPDNIEKFIDKAKDKADKFRLMGFGHRVYKNHDPRAKAMLPLAKQVLEQFGDPENPKLAIAQKLEKAALDDPYFVERKLFPNVDFYSGLVYETLGIEKEMMTLMFAMGRATGWANHIAEERGVHPIQERMLTENKQAQDAAADLPHPIVQTNENKIVRPYANYTGSGARCIVKQPSAKIEEANSQAVRGQTKAV